MVSRGSRRRTNTSITRSVSWTDTRSIRSMSTNTTKPTRKGVKEPINETWFLTRHTSAHAMIWAMNNQWPRSMNSPHASCTAIAKAHLVPIFLTKRAMVQTTKAYLEAQSVRTTYHLHSSEKSLGTWSEKHQQPTWCPILNRTCHEKHYVTS